MFKIKICEPKIEYENYELFTDVNSESEDDMPKPQIIIFIKTNNLLT